MAPVVKRLRPRIVVPICMGSNPIRRPIKNKLPKGSFLMRMMRMRTHFRFERERAKGGGSFFGRSKSSEKKVRRPVKRERARQSHQAPHKKYSDFLLLCFLFTQQSNFVPVYQMSNLSILNLVQKIAPYLLLIDKFVV